MQNSTSINEKVIAGFCWNPVTIVKKYYGLGESVEIEVERIKNIDKPHKFTVGVSVLLINNDAENPQIKATVSYLKGNKMRLMAFGEVMDMLGDYDKGLTSVELVYDDRPYQTMYQAVQEVIQSKSDFIKTLLSLKEGKSSFSHPSIAVEKYPNIMNHRGLNDSQKEAILSAISTPDVAIIHGPPGTGKTTTLVALIMELIHTEKRILVCASSNNAVDLLAQKLDQQKVDILRVGNLSRIDDDITHLTIEEKLRSHAEWSHVKKVRIKAQDCEQQASKYKRSFGPEERNLRRELRQEARDLRNWAIELEDRICNELVSKSKVIATTLISSNHRLIQDFIFDTVIIDEASQALEPETWNAILRGKRVILAGDYMQLPPTVKSNEAQDKGMSITLLDQWIHKVNYGGLLKVQYRMHKDILAFSNLHFYNGLLSSDVKIALRTLRNDGEPLVMLDTAGCGFEEEQHSETRSFFNKGEFFILREHILSIRERLLGYSIGIISPYAEQVRYIKGQIEEDTLLRAMDIDVNSIDGFQGQEKDIIYISWVRSNDKGEIGFVKDERRLNVAMTRAKSKLIIIGDSATLGTYPIYGKLVDFIHDNGYYDSAWAYMNSY
jgi:superfamily I DNA and/or RNA helicase